MTVFWKICLQCVYLVISRRPSAVLRSLHMNHHPSFTGKIPPHLFVRGKDKATLWVLTRKMNMHQFSHMSLISKFHRNAMCHSIFFFFFLWFSHTLWDVVVRRCSLPCRFHQIQGTRDGTTPSDSQAYSMTAERKNAKRQGNKNKNKLLISAKCASFIVRHCRFKLMGLILSAPKNSRYSTNFQCHWICMCVRRGGEQGVGGARGMGGDWDYSECHPTSSLNHPLSIHRRPTVLRDSLAMMPVKWDQ